MVVTGGVAIRGLSRHFGEVTALQGVDLDVEPGQIHALLGPNGAGKTTLLRILAGLTDPSAGEVMIDGRDVQSLGYRQRRKLFSLVPSGERTSYMRLSGFENLFFFARLYGIPRRAARSRAWECLSLVGLGEAGERRVGLYSQGMQKRLSIARGLLVDPPLLLIDEATQSLDPDGARTTRQLVREAAERGTAVIWTTQRLDEIRGFADRVTLLRQGEVRFRGTVAELSGTVVTKSFLLQVGQRGDLAPEEILRDLAEVAPAGAGHYRVRLRDGVSLGNALAALVEHEIEILACREEVSDVEEAFMRLTTG